MEKELNSIELKSKDLPAALSEKLEEIKERRKEALKLILGNEDIRAELPFFFYFEKEKRTLKDLIDYLKKETHMGISSPYDYYDELYGAIEEYRKIAEIVKENFIELKYPLISCLLYTSPSPRD